MAHYRERPENAPSPSDLADDEREPLPAWARRPPLTYRDGPSSRRIGCDEHPHWHVEGGREFVLDGAERHITKAHAARADATTEAVER